MSIDIARHLRQQQTEAEMRLWALLRARQLSGYRFRRQHPIGKFIADFACTKFRLIVEADGGQHADSSADAARTHWLNKQGWAVIRFWNNEILSNSDGVSWVILKALHERESNRNPQTEAESPSPPTGERA